MENVNLLKLSNYKSNKLTRDFICDAFSNLLKEKSFDDITIVELCSRAKVSRQAFYNNYKNKKDVFSDIIIKINSDVLNQLGRPFTNYSLSYYENFFKIIDNYSEVITTAYECGFQAEYLNITNEIILSKDDIFTEEEKIKRLMWNGAIQNIMHEWITKGKKESIYHMAKLTYGTLHGGKEKC